MNNYRLNGEFKFKILDKDKKTRVESNYFPNFITSKGLSFPYYTGFAGLLNYLSLGTGTGNNYIGASSSATSGLYAPIRESGFFNSTGFLDQSVGSSLNSSGITFYKTWAVPSLDLTASKDYPIKEFSVSTFSPDIFISGQEILKGNIYSEDPRLIISKYLNLTGAFSRVTGDFQLNSGEQLFVTYRLNLGFETGIKKFVNVVNTAGANTSKESYKSFNYFSGIYSLTSPAVNFLLPLENSSEEGDPGEVKEVAHIGLGMEPSTPASNLFCYFSEDESQFLLKTSGDGGVFATSQEYINNDGWENSQGVHQYISEAPIFKDAIKENVRYKSIEYPSTGDIFQSEQKDSYIFKNTTSNILTQPQYFKIDGTGRERSILRSFSFLANENNENYKFKSLVLGYQKSEGGSNPDGKQIIPFADCLLGTSSGELKPETGVYQKLEGEQYVDYTGWFLNSGDYLNLDGNNNLTLTFKLIWSSPCSDAVDC